MRKVTNWIARENICLIFTNQLRTRMGVSFGDQWTTSGGKAIAFHSSVRLRLKSVGQIKVTKEGRDEILGIKTRAQVIKNRMGPPQRQAAFDIYFDSGIADYGSWIKVLKENNIVKQGGAYYTYKKNDGSDWKFQSKDFVTTMQTDATLKEEMYLKICDAVIMKYKDPNSVIVDDAVVDTDEETAGNEE
mgnify:CR=1 FL=1